MMKKFLIGIVTLLAAAILSSQAFGAIVNNWGAPEGGTFTFNDNFKVVEGDNPYNLGVGGSTPGFNELPDAWGANLPLIEPDTYFSFDPEAEGDNENNKYGSATFDPGVEILVIQWDGYQYGFLFENYVTEVSWDGLRYAVSHVDGYNAVPVPAAVWLLGSGMLGLVAIRRRRS